MNGVSIRVHLLICVATLSTDLRLRTAPIRNAPSHRSAANKSRERSDRGREIEKTTGRTGIPRRWEAISAISYNSRRPKPPAVRAQPCSRPTLPALSQERQSFFGPSAASSSSLSHFNGDFQTEGREPQFE
uniref:Uncharacterized protein n=1 Tax=Anopheles albimanus TaxID=7167 RepID=A0A182F1N7_ANOAL